MVRQNAVRLSEVAKRAGCSTATVSRTLNNPNLVNVEIRARVDEAIRALGYMRNGAARALRSRRSFTIGVVIPTLDHAIYAGLVGALQSTISDAGYSTLITTSDFRIDQEMKRAKLLVERGIDGLVLVGHLHNEELYTLLQRTNIPYVNTYTYQPDSPHPSVGFDNRAATEKVTKLMLDFGHREFALLVGIRENNDRVEDRIQGTIRALTAAGISLPPSRIVEERYSIDGGRQGLRRLLQQERKPTALVCGSDVLAFGAVIECTSKGISVPGQLSIVGFDNLELAAHLNPPLTTIEVPAAEMGRRAAAYLLARLNDRPASTHQWLETNLIVRQTVSVPKNVARKSTRVARG